MSYHTFHDPQLPDLPVGSMYHLTGAEAHHAAQVRRIRAGETIDVVDGGGRRVRATVVDVARDNIALAVSASWAEPAPAVSITLVQALGKGGRDEAAIEAATEVGVDGVIAWESARCVARWRGEKERKGLHRWEAILTGAMKQSRRSHLPRLRGYARGRELANLLPPAAHLFILHETATQPLTAADLPVTGHIILIVGPEGGLTPDEVGWLAEATPHSHLVRLGSEVLRTSTAGPAAIAVLNTRLRRW